MMPEIGEGRAGHGLPHAGDAVVGVVAPIDIHQPRGRFDEPILDRVHRRDHGLRPCRQFRAQARIARVERLLRVAGGDQRIARTH